VSQAVSHVHPPVLDRVFGQEGAVALLAASSRAPVESYLFVGPTGSGKRDAALAFAACLVCPFGGCGVCSACTEALAERHPDVIVIERSGASISVEEARTVTALAQRTPTAAARQVLILVDFHLVSQAAPALLKTIEEPPTSTTFVILAEQVPPALMTVASRCLRVPFNRLSADALAAALIADGVSEPAALRAAEGAAGRLDRARLLALDEGFVARQSRWKAIPERLDGSGATVAVLAAELIAAGEELVSVLKEQQAAELAVLTEASTNAGERRLVGRPAIEERHRREQRRVRADELRAGFAILAGAYRGRLVTPGLQPRRIAALLAAIDAISDAAASLVRNPNETLLLQSLLIGLDGAS
jgi:DNA polymerase III subunit delta'